MSHERNYRGTFVCLVCSAKFTSGWIYDAISIERLIPTCDQDEGPTFFFATLII